MEENKVPVTVQNNNDEAVDVSEPAQPAIEQPKATTAPQSTKKKSGIGKKILGALLVLILIGGAGYAGYAYAKNQSQKDADAKVAELQKQIDELKNVSENSSTKTSPTYDANLLIDYGGDGVVVKKETDTLKLNGASSEFKNFVVSELNKLNKDKGSECDADAGVTVFKIYNDSVAVAGVGACGGATELWAKDGGTWKSVDGTQNLGFHCATLLNYEVPDTIAGSKYCFDKDGEVRRYGNFKVGEIVSNVQLDKELGQQ